MKFFVISDNVDTLVGMRLVGIEGVVVHLRQEVLVELEKAMQDKENCIVLITTKLVELCPEVISELKLTRDIPLIVEIPDRHGGTNIGETIDKYVSEAIGIKI
ncbi:MAG TPA: V-type ATP synthase subunit F [Bacillota bacterium]|nr:V-type ATP synthase subunit F [Bacillota bacterium]HPF42208.1 V-type ATP synthase subunit F [Bacillota bacterium]HPQ61763.1 V-type ATP synthase subunit F [Bacillota bacterium]HRX91251.1 V-type ATP synthase subunit F [Candidatus Izemoplasmatales bacterium]